MTASALATKPPTAIRPDYIESAGLNPAIVEAVICIPSYRRPDMLSATLDSLVNQQTQVNFAVVIIDNDDAGRAGLAVGVKFLDRLAGIVTIEPRQGNCHAINSAFALARAAFPQTNCFLMIDDDEIARPGWLQAMVDAARTSQADIIGGPVFPLFHEKSTEFIQKHPLFWPPYDKSGEIPMLYGSGNCLIHRRAFAALATPDFDLRYNFLGGGDTDFFTRCKLAGLRTYWTQAAAISETIPAKRTCARWILKRGLRIGAINFELDRRYTKSALGPLAAHLKNIAIIPLAMLRCLRALFKTGNWLIAAHPLMIALGRILASFKVEPQEYSAAEATPE